MYNLLYVTAIPSSASPVSTTTKAPTTTPKPTTKSILTTPKRKGKFLATILDYRVILSCLNINISRKYTELLTCIWGLWETPLLTKYGA